MLHAVLARRSSTLVVLKKVLLYESTSAPLRNYKGRILGLVSKYGWNSVRKLIRFIWEALKDSFGISTCIMEDSLLTVLGTECLTLGNSVGSKSRCNGSTSLFLAAIITG
jgi:hypothetical protein